jgi:hypothetical protein
MSEFLQIFRLLFPKTMWQQWPKGANNFFVFDAGLVAQFCNPSYWEARTCDALRSPGPPQVCGIYSDFVSAPWAWGGLLSAQEEGPDPSAALRQPTGPGRVANLGDFPPKNANLGIFLAIEELGDF